MKKIIILASALIFHSLNGNAQNSTPLNENPLFISTLSKQADISSLLENAIPYTQKNITNVTSKLTQLQNEVANTSMSESEVYSRLALILKIENENVLKSYLSEINANLITLKSQYGSQFTSEYVNSEAEKVLKMNPQISILKGENIIAKVSNAAAYGSCTTVAFATAALAYGGCLGTIFGAPICMTLVLIGQTAAIHQCAAMYQ